MPSLPPSNAGGGSCSLASKRALTAGYQLAAAVIGDSIPNTIAILALHALEGLEVEGV